MISLRRFRTGPGSRPKILTDRLRCDPQPMRASQNAGISHRGAIEEQRLNDGAAAAVPSAVNVTLPLNKN